MAGMIALIDYGAGNLRSVYKALKFVGADVKIVQRPEELAHSGGVVLPGVGAFDDCLNALRKQELLDASCQYMKAEGPFLGIAWVTRLCLKKARSSTVARPGWEFSAAG